MPRKVFVDITHQGPDTITQLGRFLIAFFMNCCFEVGSELPGAMSSGALRFNFPGHLAPMLSGTVEAPGQAFYFLLKEFVVFRAADDPALAVRAYLKPIDRCEPGMQS